MVCRHFKDSALAGARLANTQTNIMKKVPIPLFGTDREKLLLFIEDMIISFSWRTHCALKWNYIVLL